MCIENTVELLSQQACTFRVIDHIRDGTITDTPNCFVNHMKRNEKPLPWPHRVSEAIWDGEIKLCCQEDAVKEVFQLRAIDLGQLVARHHLNVRQEIGGVVCRIGDSVFHLSTSNADLVDQLRKFCKKKNIIVQEAQRKHV